MKVMDKLAPVTTKTVSNKPKLPQFNDNLACEIRKEGGYRKSGTKTEQTQVTTISSIHNAVRSQICCHLQRKTSTKQHLMKISITTRKFLEYVTPY